ncbi:MAG: mCpol domain-containing protein [Candidatus Thiodiazotropha sp.]
MLKYISIDGDDIGRMITSLYLSNNEKQLRHLSASLKESTLKVADFLSNMGFDIIFCAADGVVASTKKEQDYQEIFKEISFLSPDNITYSAGVGDSLKEAYIALLSAKSNGKKCLHNHSSMTKKDV